MFVFCRRLGGGYSLTVERAYVNVGDVKCAMDSSRAVAKADRFAGSKQHFDTYTI